MEERIQNLRNEALAQIMSAQNQEEMEALRVTYLGRQGEINQLLKELKDQPVEKRAIIGQILNEAKEVIEKALWERKDKLTEGLTDEWFDLTIPGEKPKIGHLHAQTKVLAEIKNIFTYLGYQVTDGPEIETDYYNFEALNIPKDHPARDTQQTLYITEDIILRTQTSAMQGRVMSKIKPPFKVLVPGKNFRYEQVDASHGFEFWQVEGFVVDENIKLTDLFGTIDFILKNIFGENSKIRFATTNFPFVEPGIDTYIECTICRGKGCAFCKKTGWSEIMPAGMIHPFVLKEAGIDSKIWGGFAFAIGLSRVVTLKYQISDLRILTNPDMRIIRQF